SEAASNVEDLICEYEQGEALGPPWWTSHVILIGFCVLNYLLQMERQLRSYARTKYSREVKDVQVEMQRNEENSKLFPYFIQYKMDQILHQKKHTNYLQKLPKDILNEIIKLVKDCSV